METVVLVIHLLLAVALVISVLIQRSEGGALGMGGGGGGGGLMTGRSAANMLTRTTAILAGCFMLTSIVLTILNEQKTEPTSLIDSVEQSSEQKSEQPSLPTVPFSDN